MMPITSWGWLWVYGAQSRATGTLFGQSSTQIRLTRARDQLENLASQVEQIDNRLGKLVRSSIYHRLTKIQKARVNIDLSFKLELEF